MRSSHRPDCRDNPAHFMAQSTSFLSTVETLARVADIAFPVDLRKSRSEGLDALFEMPAGSALTVARVGGDGRVSSLDWRGTGEWGFYPASTVKLTAAALLLQFLDRYGLPLDAVVRVGDDLPMTFRELLAETIVFSGNDTYCTIQECVGFAETYAEMKRWGVSKARIRRHFKVPRYNHSNEVIVTGLRGEELLRLPARPAVDIPAHDGNGPGEAHKHNLESNWWCTDDLVRAMAAILFGPTRRTAYFPDLLGWCGCTNQCRLRDGLRKVTAGDPGYPQFVILNKPGWWPDDFANVEMGYVYDVQRDEHYLVGLYYHGTFEASEVEMPMVCRKLFEWLRSSGSWG